MAAWNGLAVAALAEAGVLLQEPTWVTAAEETSRLVRDLHWVDGRLRRVSRDGVVGPHAGVLEDYADVAEGLLALYWATGDLDHLRGAHARLEVDGVVTETRGHISSERPGAPREVWVDSPVGSARLREVLRFTDPADAVASGSLLAPMPGTVVRVAVEHGAEVVAGQAVLVLEAMKMQHTVSAPTAGVVTEIDVKPGAQVAAGEVLAVVADDAPTETES